MHIEQTNDESHEGQAEGEFVMQEGRMECVTRDKPKANSSCNVSDGPLYALLTLSGAVQGAPPREVPRFRVDLGSVEKLWWHDIAERRVVFPRQCVGDGVGDTWDVCGQLWLVHGGSI